MDTFKNALKETLRIGGREILREKNRLAAYLADLLPGQKREVRIFSKSCSDAMLRMFDEADSRDGESQLRTVYKVRHMLMEEEGLTEEWAEKMVRALAYALDWDCESCQEAGLKKDETIVETGSNNLYAKFSMFIERQEKAYNDLLEKFKGLEKRLEEKESRETVCEMVIAIGSNRAGQCDVKKWKEIMALACRGVHTV